MIIPMNEISTILIDIDDVLINLCETWCDWLDNKYNVDISVNDICDWNICRFFPSLTKEQVFEPLLYNNFWRMIKPKSDAMEYVERLFNEGYKIFLCTSTDYRNIQAKYELVVQRYFPYIKWSHVIVANKKQMIKADYLIDDGIHNLENGSYIKILMTAPHNKDYDAESNGMIRVDNWKEIYEVIKSDRYNK